MRKRLYKKIILLYLLATTQLFRLKKNLAKITFDEDDFQILNNSQATILTLLSLNKFHNTLFVTQKV